MDAELLGQLERSTRAVTEGLARLDEAQLRSPCALPGWTRLTIACHLRYGADALHRMTADIVAGRPTSFYPRGRAVMRESTLRPAEGEPAAAVVRGLEASSRRLHRRWAEVDDWSITLREPDGCEDLGALTLHQLAILRLTEIEVHGTDLDLGLGPWSDVFVDRALAMRLDWLPRRRSNHRAVPRDVTRSFLLDPTDRGARVVVNVAGPTVTVRAADGPPPTDIVVRASSRELLALLLGRSDLPEAEDFGRLFPGP